MGIKILIEIFFSLKKDNRTGGHEVALVKYIRKYSLSTDCVITRLTHISGGRITHRLKMLDSR